MTEKDDLKKKLKTEIFSKLPEYYSKILAPETTFVPGKTRIHYSRRVFDASELTNLLDASLDFWLTLGPYGAKFESALAKFLGVHETVLVNSGSSANLVMLASLLSEKIDGRLKQGDEIITPAVTFPTTLTPIIQNNLTPVFVDVELETFNIDATKLENAVTEKTKAIFMPHTLGLPCNMDAVMEVVEKHDLFLLEDSCDALGATYNNKLVGTFGDLASLSFYPAHHITMGEGGAVIINDPKYSRIVRSIRDWGRDCYCKGDSGINGACGKRLDYEIDGIPYDHRYVYTHQGYNLKPTDLQAAIGLAQLEKAPKFIEARRNNFKKLRKGLEKHSGKLILPRVEEKANPSPFAFPITVRKDAGFTRKEITQFLEKANIETRLIFCGNALRQPAFKNMKCRTAGELTNSDEVMRNSFFIGVYPGLTEEMISYVLSKFDEFLASH